LRLRRGGDERADDRHRLDSRLSARAGSRRGAHRPALPLHTNLQPLCGDGDRARRRPSRRPQSCRADRPLRSVDSSGHARWSL